MTHNKRRRRLPDRRDDNTSQKPTLKAIWERPVVKRLATAKHPTTGEPTKYLWGRVGLDAGGAVLTRLYESGAPIDKKDFPRDSRLFEFAIEAGRFLVLLFGNQDIVFVKNDDDKGVVAREALETLRDVQSWDGKERVDFFQRTGIIADRKHWLVTKHRTQKGMFCKRHLLNFLVEDKAQVGRYLPRNTLFLWFGTEAREDEMHKQAVLARARGGRLKFQQVTDWKRVVVEVLRYYPNWEECLEGRPPREQEEIVGLYMALMLA